MSALRLKPDMFSVSIKVRFVPIAGKDVPHPSARLALRRSCSVGVKAAERLCLNSVGHGADQELAASVARRIGAPQSAPLHLKLGTRAIRKGEDPRRNRGLQFLL